MHLLVDYMTTKRVIAPALRAAVGEAAYTASGTPITDTLNRLALAATASGDIRPGIGPEDLYRIMVGISHGYERPDWEPSARRLIDIMMAGLKPA